ncbi:DUF5979 domain-containing protein [uncultured Acetatifactor sp.]|jgi:hypothetical protein|uniref:DUF5979 domain-containing protein n=1 Tax=uncultured Acetatifactor sp. TaxID=1671927 RepID=UPI00261715C8|nr:DUF5979 domain-containing protein [uncultured Acetatifactor sp.]
MKKRWIYLLTALTLAVGMCIAEPMAGIAAPLEADDEGFVAGSCSLTVYPEDPHKEGADSFGEDLAGADVVVDLYQVARAVKTSGQDTYHYELTGEYASLKLPDSPEEGAQPAASWEETAQQAAAIALDAASPCTPVSGSGESAGTKVGNLAPGLYLLVARGRNLTELADYKIEIEQTDSLTQEESKRIATIANSQQYTYAFLPQLVSLPTKEADANGVINTANPGDWIFEASVNLKPERLDRYGSLEIVKTLSEYETMGGVQESATFVFEVTGMLDDQVVYSNVESITFTAAGQERVVLDRIPAMAQVTVREVYSGSSYQLTVPGDRTATIAADDVVSVEFENEYDGRRTNGHGIKNQFVYDEEAGAWHWYSSPAQEAAGNQGEPPAGN